MKRRSFFSKLAGVAVAALMAPEIIRGAVMPRDLGVVQDNDAFLQVRCYLDLKEDRYELWGRHRDGSERLIATSKCAHEWLLGNGWTIKPESSGK